MAGPAPESEQDKLTDEQLVARYQRGHEPAFAELVHRYRQELFHFLLRFTGSRATAEDVFQEAFLQVHLSVESFDTSRRFKPWLFTIAANKARDYLRRQSRRPASELSAPIDAGGDQSRAFIDLMQADLPMPDDRLQREELQQSVQRVIEQMPDHLREILLLAHFQKFSYNEIADILGIPLGTVKSRLHTAVGTFADRWKKQNHDAGPT